MSIAAAIVAYNPEIERLWENVSAVQSQVDKLLIIDNGSFNREAFGNYPNVSYILSDENKGIAWALNRSFEWAQANAIDWLLTLDQDSVVEANFVRKLMTYVEKTDVEIGLVFPRIFDPSANKAILEENPLVRWLRFFKRNILSWVSYLPITSGSLVKVEAFLSCGGLDEEYFIENVDYCLDLKLLRKRYCLVFAENAVLEQRFGSPRHTTKNYKGGIYISGHSAWRYYYVYRNRVWLHRYFFVQPSWFAFDDLIFLLKIPVYWLLGERSIARGMFLGIKDGLCLRKKTHDEIVGQFSQHE